MDCSLIFWLEEFSHQVLEDEVSCDAFGEQLIEHGTDSAQLGWALLLNYFSGNVGHKTFVIRSRDSSLICQIRGLQLGSLQHHYSSSHVSARVVRDSHS